MIIREQRGQEYDERGEKAVEAVGGASRAHDAQRYSRRICARVDTRENTILKKTGTLR